MPGCEQSKVSAARRVPLCCLVRSELPSHPSKFFRTCVLEVNVGTTPLIGVVVLKVFVILFCVPLENILAEETFEKFGVFKDVFRNFLAIRWLK